MLACLGAEKPVTDMGQLDLNLKRKISVKLDTSAEYDNGVSLQKHADLIYRG